MTPQKTTLQIFKSIAGAVIAGLGMFILYENLAGAVERLRHILVNGSAALGGLRRPSCFFRKTYTRMLSITSGWSTFSFSRCWDRRSGRCYGYLRSGIVGRYFYGELTAGPRTSQR